MKTQVINLWLSSQAITQHSSTFCFQTHLPICLTLDSHYCHMGTAIKYPVPDRVKPSFVIFLTSGHSKTLSPKSQSAQMSKITNPVWHRMLYSCTHVATVGVKGLKFQDVTEVTGWKLQPRSRSCSQFFNIKSRRTCENTYHAWTQRVCWQQSWESASELGGSVGTARRHTWYWKQWWLCCPCRVSAHRDLATPAQHKPLHSLSIFHLYETMPDKWTCSLQFSNSNSYRS